MLAILKRFQLPFEIVWLVAAFIALPWLADLIDSRYWMLVEATFRPFL